MAKRFTDTDKYKKPFIRSLKAPYKLLWDYLYHNCDHAGIWIVDFDIAQIYIGSDAPIDKIEAIKVFNDEEIRIIEISKNKWFIPSFIEFQYGSLNPANRAHNSVIKILKSNNLINEDMDLISPLQGVKDKDKVKELDKDKDKDIPKIKNFKQWTLEEFKQNILDNRKEYSDTMLAAFGTYWSEPDPKGKMRFQLNKTWSTAGRLRTWKTNDSKFGIKNGLGKAEEYKKVIMNFDNS